MKKLSKESKRDALNNTLNAFDFNAKYYIVISDRRIGERFAIASSGEYGALHTHTEYLTYNEMNQFLKGYHMAKTKQF